MKGTGIYCEQQGCNSNNATIIINKQCYCARHAYYKQTGRILDLELKDDEPETCWKWELEEINCNNTKEFICR